MLFRLNSDSDSDYDSDSISDLILILKSSRRTAAPRTPFAKPFMKRKRVEPNYSATGYESELQNHMWVSCPSVVAGEAGVSDIAIKGSTNLKLVPIPGPRCRYARSQFMYDLNQAPRGIIRITKRTPRPFIRYIRPESKHTPRTPRGHNRAEQPAEMLTV